jgi:2'-5' RNA ligase
MIRLTQATRRVRAASTAGPCVLLVPVTVPPGVPRVLDSASRRLWRSVPLHVTLLYPFVTPRSMDNELISAIERVLEGHPAFAFSMTAVDSFPRVRYLRPEPATPFVSLIRDLERAWPEWPRYGGAFETAIPHVTIATGRRARRSWDDVEARLPIDVRAERVELWHQTPLRRWSMDHRFELPSLTLS